MGKNISLVILMRFVGGLKMNRKGVTDLGIYILSYVAAIAYTVLVMASFNGAFAAGEDDFDHAVRQLDFNVKVVENVFESSVENVISGFNGESFSVEDFKLEFEKEIKKRNFGFDVRNLFDKIDRREYFVELVNGDLSIRVNDVQIKSEFGNAKVSQGVDLVYG